MKGQFQTDKGQVRSHNEDSGGVFFNQAGQFLAIVADGMGGHQAGDVASQMAISLLQQAWESTAEFNSSDETEDWLSTTIHDINDKLYDHAQHHKECVGMGTTVVAAVCIPDSYVTVAHIGDSRCYKQNKGGMKQLTQDHSLVNELVRTGQISKDEAEEHPRKNVLLKAMGTEKGVAADIQTIEWEMPDKLLLCSDGLTNKVSDDELQQLIEKEQPIETIGTDMINLANQRGGEDNISLVIVHQDSSEKAGDS